MSYIRMSQSGSYVDIPCGSIHYIYDNGSDISGWSYGQFAALIGQVADEIDISQEKATEIKGSFRAHFCGWETDYRGGISRPERAEIFCQCVDRRIEALKLTDSLQEAVQEWADEFDHFDECEYCGEQVRPAIYNEETPYVCSDESCELKSEAERYSLTVEQMKEARSFDDFDDEWDYIVEHSDEDLL